MATTTAETGDQAITMEEPIDASAILRNAQRLAPWLPKQDATASRRNGGCPTMSSIGSASPAASASTVPAAWGGPECTPLEAVEITEAIAVGDTSAAWCVMIGCDAGLYSAWLDDGVAREMYTSLDSVQAGWIYPVGTAAKVDGGFHVTGDWMFGSGCQHSDWIAAGCLVVDGGRSAPGRTASRLAGRAGASRRLGDPRHVVHDGPGGHRQHRLPVPRPLRARGAVVQLLRSAERDGTLYGSRDILLGKLPGTPLGLARAAIDKAVAVLEGKVDRVLGIPYRSMPRVQEGVARAEGLLGSARAYAFDALARQWARLEREPLSKKERADVWLSRLQSAQSARDVARLVYDLIGGSAIYRRRSPFDRFLRDTETMCQHIVAQEKGYELVGAMLLDPEGASAHPML